MSFNRDNYKRIKEEYDGKYLKAREASNMRCTLIHAELPEIAEIDRQLSHTGLEIFEAAMTGRVGDIDRIKEKTQALTQKRRELLEAAGYPADFTDVKYECELCGDTGAVDNRMCTCMRKELVEAGIQSSGMADLISRQTFENFSLD